jgi:hypothetical protein
MDTMINPGDSFEIIHATLDAIGDAPLWDSHEGFRLWLVSRNATHERLIGFDKDGTLIEVWDSDFGRKVRKLGM